VASGTELSRFIRVSGSSLLGDEVDLMAETILNLEMTGAIDEHRLAKAVDEFTRWRGAAALPCAADNDAPDIMIKTTWGHSSIRKTLIFQDALWADKFLALWQSGQKLQA
jgi:hypothetical protein